MPLPAQRTVHGTVTDLFTGAGPATTITITALPRRWTDEVGDQLLVSPDHAVPVTNGAWSIALVPTDAAGIEPVTGRYYRIQEVISGVPRRARTFEVPTGDMTPVSIRTLIVDDPGLPGYVRGATGPRGPQGPEGPEGPAGSGGTPNAHAGTHSSGGSDPVSPASIGAATVSALSAHTAATTGVHGIADTGLLETMAGAAAKVSAHAGASDPHGDRAYADTTLLAKAANLSDVANPAAARTSLGLGSSATRNVGASAGTVAAGDDSRLTDSRTPTSHATSHGTGGSDPVTPAAIGAATAAALTAHTGATTSVHGIADTSALETTTGAAAKVSTHAGATDPHGDRAWATGQFYPASSGSALDGYLSDLLTRLSAVEGGTAFLSGLNVTGLSRIINTVLQVEGPSSAVRHTLDGAANKLGFHGASPVARQTVNGSRGDGSAYASLLSALATLGLVTDSSTAGPAGPGWADRPSDQNLLAWTYDPNMAGHVTAQSNAGVAGRITLVRIILREAITWSNIWIGLAGIDAAASLANCYLGVYDSSGTLKGTTADISASLMTSAIAKALPLASPFSAAAGTYYIAMLLNGTWTTNSLTFKSSGAGISVNAGLSAPNLRYSNLLTGQTSLPSSLTLSGQSTSIINTGWASQWYGVS